MTSLAFNLQHADEFLALIAIAEGGSFIEAANRLQRHPSVISKRITALESRLGIRLIERSTRSMTLTEAGAILFERLKYASNVIDEAEREANHLSRSATGHLRLALPGSMGRRWLGPLISRFSKLHSGLTVHAEYSDGYVDVISESFDACIRIGALVDSRLVATHLCDQIRILCASPVYLKSFGSPEHPSELNNHRFLGHTGLKSYPDLHLAKGDESVSIHTRRFFTSNDGDALVEAAKQGLGIMGCSNWLVAREIRDGHLARVLSGWTFDKNGAIYLVRPSSKFTPSKTNAFINFAKAQFESGPPWGKYWD